MTTFRCETGYCNSVFEHDHDDDCETVELPSGLVSHSVKWCEKLVNAGWRPIWIRVTTDYEKKERHIFSRGGWICPDCVKHYAKTRTVIRKRKRPTQARRTTRRSH